MLLLETKLRQYNYYISVYLLVSEVKPLNVSRGNITGIMPSPNRKSNEIQSPPCHPPKSSTCTQDNRLSTLFPNPHSHISGGSTISLCCDFGVNWDISDSLIYWHQDYAPPTTFSESKTVYHSFLCRIPHLTNIFLNFNQIFIFIFLILKRMNNANCLVFHNL